MNKTMTAKFAGTCRVCGESFPVGAAIVYAGRGNCRHVACPSLTPRSIPWGLSPSEISVWLEKDAARIREGHARANEYKASLPEPTNYYDRYR